MNAKAQQINHEVIGQHSSQLKGETMNTKMIKDSRKRFLSLTAAAVLAAAMSSNALAAGSSATINLDNSVPRIFLDDCPATSSVMASGMSNFAVRFRVRYAPDSFSDKTKVWQDTTTSFSVKSDINNPQNSTFPFRPGIYQVDALNTSGQNAKIQLTISCQ